MRKKNGLLRYLCVGISPALLLSLFVVGCSPKKGKLIAFESLSSYYPYPRDLEKFGLYLQEGQPDYVIFQHEGYQERWVYVCKDAVFNFKPLSEGKSQPLQVSSQALRGTKIEEKLSPADRERLGHCKEDSKAGPTPEQKREGE